MHLSRQGMYCYHTFCYGRLVSATLHRYIYELCGFMLQCFNTLLFVWLGCGDGRSHIENNIDNENKKHKIWMRFCACVCVCLCFIPFFLRRQGMILPCKRFSNRNAHYLCHIITVRSLHVIVLPKTHRDVKDHYSPSTHYACAASAANIIMFMGNSTGGLSEHLANLLYLSNWGQLGFSWKHFFSNAAAPSSGYTQNN